VCGKWFDADAIVGMLSVQVYVQNYFSAVSDLHSKEVAGYLSTLTGKLKKANDEDKFDGCKLDPPIASRSMLKSSPQPSPRWRQLRRTRAGPSHGQRQ
jgi:hypothetical protein